MGTSQLRGLLGRSERGRAYRAWLLPTCPPKSQSPECRTRWELRLHFTHGRRAGRPSTTTSSQGKRDGPGIGGGKNQPDAESLPGRSRRERRGRAGRTSPSRRPRSASGPPTARPPWPVRPIRGEPRGIGGPREHPPDRSQRLHPGKLDAGPYSPLLESQSTGPTGEMEITDLGTRKLIGPLDRLVAGNCRY